MGGRSQFFGTQSRVTLFFPQNQKAFGGTNPNTGPVRLPAHYMSLGDITLSGLGLQANGDWGIALIDKERILVNGQTNAAENGLYIAHAGVWERAIDFKNAIDVYEGVLVVVSKGLTQADTLWELATDDPIIVGVTPLSFVKISGAASIIHPRTVYIRTNGNDATAIIGDEAFAFLTVNAAITAAALAGGPMVFVIGVGTFIFTLDLNTNDNWSWQLTEETTLTYTGLNAGAEVTANNFTLIGGNCICSQPNVPFLWIHNITGKNIVFKPRTADTQGIVVYGDAITNCNIDISGDRTTNGNSSLIFTNVMNDSSVNIWGTDFSTGFDGIQISKNVNYFGKARTTVGYGISFSDGGVANGTADAIEFIGNGGLFVGEVADIYFAGAEGKAISTNAITMNTVYCNGSFGNVVSVAGNNPNINCYAGELEVQELLFDGNLINQFAGNLTFVSSAKQSLSGGATIDIQDGIMTFDCVVNANITIAAPGILRIWKIVNGFASAVGTGDVIVNLGGGRIELYDGSVLRPNNASAYGIRAESVESIYDYRNFSKGVLGGAGDWTISQTRSILLTVTADNMLTTVDINATTTTGGAVGTTIVLAGLLAASINGSGEPVTATDNLDGTVTVVANVAGTTFTDTALNNLTETLNRSNNSAPTMMIGGGVIISPNA